MLDEVLFTNISKLERLEKLTMVLHGEGKDGWNEMDANVTFFDPTKWAVEGLFFDRGYTAALMTDFDVAKYEYRFYQELRKEVQQINCVKECSDILDFYQ